MAGLVIPPRHSPAGLRTLLNALATVELPAQPVGTSLPASSDRDSVIVVHADTARAGAGPPGAAHLLTARLAEYTKPAAEGDGAKAAEAAA